jgi:hypothetical protein
MLISLAFLAAGCGQSAFDKANNDLVKSLSALGLAQDRERIYNDELKNAADLPAAVRAYIDAIRAAIDDKSLEGKAAERLLLDMADDVSYYCPDCADALDRERESLG